MKKIIFTLLFINFLTADVMILKTKSCTFNSLEFKDIKYIFLGKKNFINNQNIIPIDSNNEPIYEEFVNVYLNKSPSKMRTYWTRMLFTGKYKPPVSSDILRDNNNLNETNCYISYNNQLPEKGWEKVEIIH